MDLANVLEIMFDRCYCIHLTKYLLKLANSMATIFCHGLVVNAGVFLFIDIRLPGLRASSDSRWLTSSDLSSML